MDHSYDALSKIGVLEYNKKLFDAIHTENQKRNIGKQRSAILRDIKYQHYRKAAAKRHQ